MAMRTHLSFRPLARFRNRFAASRRGVRRTGRCTPTTGPAFACAGDQSLPRASLPSRRQISPDFTNGRQTPTSGLPARDFRAVQTSESADGEAPSVTAGQPTGEQVSFVTGE